VSQRPTATGGAGGAVPTTGAGGATRYRRVGGARTLVVGIADCKVTADPRQVLLTYALGSCVGVAIWNSKTREAGLLHAMLPDSRLDPARAQQNPFVFVDSGLRKLIERMKSRAASPRDLVVKVAGGASLIDTSQHFHVGKNNILAVKQVMRGSGLTVQAADIGGSGSRTMQLTLMTGRVSIRRGTKEVGAL
jgi:chemotaxis protein CheD